MVKQNLIELIESRLYQGNSPNQIRRDLIKQGYESSQIKQAFRQVQSRNNVKTINSKREDFPQRGSKEEKNREREFNAEKSIGKHISGQPWIKRSLIVLIAISIILISYSVWPFTFEYVVKDSKKNPIVSNVTITGENGNKVYSEQTSNIKKFLPKGKYTVKIEKPGFKDKQFTVKQPVGSKLMKKIKQITPDIGVSTQSSSQTTEALKRPQGLKPKKVSLKSLDFVEPTGSLELEPEIKITGTNVLGEQVRIESYDQSETLIFGNYTVEAETDSFQGQFKLIGNQTKVDGVQTKKISMKPKRDYYFLSREEVDHTFNFLEDYLSLSSSDIIPKKDRGFPEQFYLYKKDKIVSLGDMVFLACELKSSGKKENEKQKFFLPKSRTYSFGGNASDASECYRQILSGKVPPQINDQPLENFLIKTATDKFITAEFEIKGLNSNYRVAKLAFSYDIEAGRYLHEGNKNNKTISPCAGSQYNMGLSQDELVCDNANKLGWYTPLLGENTLTNHPYPVSSGISGWRDILNYSENYGIPITHFIVVRDYKAFKKSEKELSEKLKEMIEQGYVEVGSHSYYHSRFDTLSSKEVKKDLKITRDFFESELNTTLVGFRAPYHKQFENRTKLELILNETGYKYISNRQISFEQGLVNSKPMDFAVTYSPIREFKQLPLFIENVVGLAHPWNLYYNVTRKNGVKYLKENPKKSKLGKATLLVAVANGAIPRKLKEVKSY